MTKKKHMSSKKFFFLTTTMSYFMKAKIFWYMELVKTSWKDCVRCKGATTSVKMATTHGCYVDEIVCTKMDTSLDLGRFLAFIFLKSPYLAKIGSSDSPTCNSIPRFFYFFFFLKPDLAKFSWG
jgi:hypothetical protein